LVNFVVPQEKLTATAFEPATVHAFLQPNSKERVKRFAERQKKGATRPAQPHETHVPEPP
jgi:hypothetical protein